MGGWESTVAVERLQCARGMATPGHGAVAASESASGNTMSRAQARHIASLAELHFASTRLRAVEHARVNLLAEAAALAEQASELRGRVSRAHAEQFAVRPSYEHAVLAMLSDTQDDRMRAAEDLQLLAQVATLARCGEPTVHAAIGRVTALARRLFQACEEDAWQDAWRVTVEPQPVAAQVPREVLDQEQRETAEVAPQVMAPSARLARGVERGVYGSPALLGTMHPRSPASWIRRRFPPWQLESEPVTPDDRSTGSELTGWGTLRTGSHSRSSSV